MWNPLYDRITAVSESGNRDYDKFGRPIRSPAGAMYAMQTMPGTARSPGFGVRPAADNSPEEYNRVGRDYRDAMFRRYDNDPAKGWAAYNWGPGNLDKALSRYGDGWLDHAPAETRAYVNKNVSALGGQMPLRPRKPMNIPTGPSQMTVPQEQPLVDKLMETGLSLDPKPMAPVDTGLPKAGKGGILGSGLSPLELVTYGINGYLAGRGNPAGQQNLNMIAEAQNMEQAQQFNREKWAQEIEARKEAARIKALEPPQWLQDAMTYQALPQAQKDAVTGYRDAVYPVLGDYQDADGNTRTGVYSRSTHGFVQGADEKVINGKTYRRVNGEWYEVGQ